MLHDRYLFDRASGTWTVKRWLQDVKLRYGGVDSVLLWHSYPNIGVDDRSQFDMLRSLPGGVAGVRGLVDAFHAEGVKVLLPYNPWDTGTARPDNVDDVELVELIQQVDADGFNGDTMFGIDSSFYEVSISNGGKPVALQPECSADRRAMLSSNGTREPYYATGRTLAYNPLSWGYGAISAPCRTFGCTRPAPFHRPCFARVPGGVL